MGDLGNTILMVVGIGGATGILALFVSWLRGRESAARRQGADAARYVAQKKREAVGKEIAKVDRQAHLDALAKARAIQDEARRKQDAIRKKLADKLAQPVDLEELNNLIELARARRDPRLGVEDGAADRERGDE